MVIIQLPAMTIDSKISIDEKVGHHMKRYLLYIVAFSPFYPIFMVGIVLLPTAYWLDVLFFASLMGLSLLGCGIGGGYDAGCIWHYHGTPECIQRPKSELMSKE
jgi:hypothetical protein